MLSRRTLALAVLLFVCAPAAVAAKTDVVQLVNGNAITGEIKSLEFGALSYGTDSMGTVTIDWEDIVGIRSPQSLQVEITDGTRYFGTLQLAQDQYQITVNTADGEVTLAMAKIVRITPIDTNDRFWSRVEGSFGLGVTSDRASEVTTFNLATDVLYRERKYLVGFTANASITEQPGQDRSQRSTLGGNYQRFRPNRWFTDWFVNWETNQQLGIQNRFIAGGGLGRYLVQTNRNQFSMTLGVNGTREQFVGDEDSATVAEGRIQVRYLHRQLVPDAHMSMTANVYPLLSDLAVYRAETDISFRREFVKDLYLDITLYHSYTTDPPADAEKRDYGLTTSIGYSW